VEEINTHLFAVNDIDWSPHYNYMLSGSDDSLALIHDLNIQSCTTNGGQDGAADMYQKELDRNIELDRSLVRVFKAHTNHVTSVKFDSGTSLVVTGSTDRVAYLWDIRSAQYIHKIEDHAEEIYGVDISQNGRLILTAGKDGFVRLWETRNGLCLKTLKIDLSSRVGH
jgi:WD40 repeat protein